MFIPNNLLAENGYFVDVFQYILCLYQTNSEAATSANGLVFQYILCLYQTDAELAATLTLIKFQYILC